MQVTKNPLRLGWARARYDSGLALEKLLRPLRDHCPRLYKWAHAAESAQNCIIDPWLGKVSRQEHLQLKWGRVMHDLGPRIASAPNARAARRLRSRYDAAARKAVAASVARAYLTIQRYPDHPDAQATIRMHELAR